MTSILVIEDESTIRENITAVLRFEGFETYSAENGQTGVELARQHLPDLIICDVMMPELDGYGVLATLREDPGTTMIPFIFLTARADKADMRRGMHLGADDYLTKPFSQQELLEAVNSRLKRIESLKQGYSAILEDARKKLSRLVAHELRTPLISISLVQDIIGRQIGTLSETELSEMVEMLGTGTRRMSHIIEQMVFSTQLESGTLTRETIKSEGMPMPFQKILNDSLTLSNRFVSDQSKVTVQLEPVTDNIMVHCDFFAIKHAISELIANGVNFSPNGGVVEIKHSSNANRLAIQIIDQGPGIPADQIQLVFKENSQINREKSEQQGMGMGLYLAQQIIQAHGGTLTLESVVGQGTKAIINLPIEK
jgi:signal transduction histidine kinase